MQQQRNIYAGFIAMAALAASACASAPPVPEASLQAARQAITAAEGAEAARNAPAEFNEARSKLTAADAAVKAGRMESAERLALESRAAAELATARTASLKALAVNADIKAANVVLEDELARKTGESR
jgi:hypothetical protein